MTRARGRTVSGSCSKASDSIDRFGCLIHTMSRSCMVRLIKTSRGMASRISSNLRGCFEQLSCNQFVQNLCLVLPLRSAACTPSSRAKTNKPSISHTFFSILVFDFSHFGFRNMLNLFLSFNRTGKSTGQSREKQVEAVWLQFVRFFWQF